MKLEGHSAIVTGGSSGLGAATAEALANRGIKVAIFDLDGEGGRGHASRIGGTFFKVDVRNEDEVVASIDEAQIKNGIARILVNCAGVAPSISTFGYEGPHPIDAFRYTVDINLLGTYIMLSRFAARLLKADIVDEERGVIINVASIAGYDGQAGHAAYAASKAAVIGMTLPVARDLAPYAIRLMTIAPGLFATPMLGVEANEEGEGVASQVPHPHRLGRPEEFALLVESIIANPMLNGEVIRLDGALRMGPI